MIRPKRLAHATALPRRRRRLLSSNDRPPNRRPSPWQIPPSDDPPRARRPGASLKQSLLLDIQDEKEAFARWKTPSPAGLGRPLEQASRKASRKQPEPPRPNPQGLLVIRGLSPSLKAADFYRLAAKDLSDWSNAIINVSQDRDPWTLEPLGAYHIIFSSPLVATAFADKLARLLRLSQLKLHSANGLWLSQVPVHLRSGDDNDPQEEVKAFTIAPGSQPRLHMSTSGSKARLPWVRLVEKLVAGSPYPTSNGVVLLHLRNPCLVAEELMRFINQDGHERNQAWSVDKPYHLTRTLHEKDLGVKKINGRVPLPDNDEFMAKLRGRFLIVCENDDVAARFIRSWNQRTLTATPRGYTQRTVVNASLIEW